MMGFFVFFGERNVPIISSLSARYVYPEGMRRVKQPFNSIIKDKTIDVQVEICHYIKLRGRDTLIGVIRCAFKSCNLFN